MSTVRPAVAAFIAVLTASVCDWVVGELFMRRGPAADVAGALSINAVVLAAMLFAAHRLLPRRAFVVTLRGLAVCGAAVLFTSGLRGSLGSLGAQPIVRIAITLAVPAFAAGIALRLADPVADRLMRAIAIAAIAFTLAPFGLRAASSHERPWLAPLDAMAPASATRHATLFLLFDETSAPAAAPLAEELRKTGMSVRYDAVPPAEENTMNAIPAMFTGLDFSRARPCGRSSLCSGANHVDFSRIPAGRPDIHVTGILFPYCDIQGLRSCYQQPLPHEYGSAYRSLAAFWLRRASLPVPAALQARDDAQPVTKRDLLSRQVDFIDRSVFWDEGGVLYAHLPLPHPPGMDKMTSLDTDYAGNLEEARRLVSRWAARARVSFGDGAAIVIASDHPLRKYWCEATVYPAPRCVTRPEFQSPDVPWIVALPASATSPALAHNREAFQALSALAARALH